MKTPRILLIGRNGQLAFELRQTLAGVGSVVVAAQPEVDLAQPETIRAVVRAAAPNILVNAAAYTAVDKAESNPEPAWAINATAPGVLAEEARRLGALLVHYSSDYVYDGAKPGPWVETDATGPLNVYGQTKLAGDEAVAASGCDHVILRTSWVYGARGSNFLLTMLRLAAERPELRIVDDQHGCPTSSAAIAKATAKVLRLVDGRLDGRGGVYHLACAGQTTWFDFAKAFLGRLPNCPVLTPIPSSSYPVPARRPGNSVLSCEKLAEAFGVLMPAWEHALDGVLEALAESGH